MKLPEAGKLGRLFERLTRTWHTRPPRGVRPGKDLPGAARAVHYFNFALWHLEDEARRTDVPDATVARTKREIDSSNQKRNDAMERFDELLAEELSRRRIRTEDETPTNTETPGAAVDRLSVLSLKIHHMNEEARRVSATELHRKSCAEKLRVLVEQRRELSRAMDALLEELVSGKKRMRLYRQFKMYNDPELNPALYKKRPRSKPRGRKKGA